MSIINSADERVYVQASIPWQATAPNSTGTATLANGDAVRHIRCSLQGQGNLVPQRAKSGSLGKLIGQKGRRSGTFELEVPLQGSGTAGTKGDLDPILEAIFGAAGTADPGVDVEYALSDVLASLTIWKFKDPAGSNIWNQVLAGGVVNEWEINAGEEAEASLLVRGVGIYAANKPNFASLDSTAKLGLSAFPTEPASPSYNGIPALAFVGSITINGVSTFKLQSLRLFGNMNRILRPAFSSYYSLVALQGVRSIGGDFALYEEDTADMAALRQLAYTKAGFDATVAIGDTAGNIHTFALNNMVLGPEEIDDSNIESIVRFNGCEASMTSLGSNDELLYTAS
jgi:hypothetical protein